MTTDTSQSIPEDSLIQIAKDTATNTAILKEIAPLVRQTHETLHVKCGIDDNGDAGLKAIVLSDHRFTRGCRSFLSGARKAAVYGGLGVAGSALAVVLGRCVWVVVLWLW